MTVARFPVVAHLDNAGGPVQGVVLIDRETGWFHAHRARSPRRYSLPLSVVATMVCQRILLNEANEKKKAKKAKKAGRR